MHQLVIEHPTDPALTAVWDGVDEIDAWTCLFAAVAKFRKEQGLYARWCETWLGPDGELRRGVVMLIRSKSGESVPIRIAVQEVAEDDDWATNDDLD